MTTKVAYAALSLTLVMTGLWLYQQLPVYLAPVSHSVIDAKAVQPITLPESTHTTIGPPGLSTLATTVPQLLGDNADGWKAPVRLTLDNKGNFVIDRNLKRLFDHYLLELPGKPLNQVVSAIHNDLARQLDPTARALAEQIMTHYIAMKIDLQQLAESGAEIMATELTASYLQTGLERLRSRNEIRQKWLEPDVYEAFYGHEVALDNYMVERLQILDDHSLSAEQRQQALETLEQNLPDTVRQSRDNTRQHLQVAAAVAVARSNGSTPEEIHDLRAQMVGSDAASRLAALDRKRAEWNLRLDNYRDRRDQLLANGGSATQLEALRGEMFSGPERKRISLMDDSELGANKLLN
ncbi:lipase secretion chaperone [Spongorhabdus nitratireducens]